MMNCPFQSSDAGIREAECEKSAMDVKYSTDTKIEDNSRMYKLQKAHFDQEINTAVSGRADILLSNSVTVQQSFKIPIIIHPLTLNLRPVEHTHTESRITTSLRTASGQNPAKNPKRGDPNRHRRASQANRNRVAGGRAQGSRAQGHR